MEARMSEMNQTDEKEEQMTTGIVLRETTEEEKFFTLFCDCVDNHLVWRGQPPIASTDDERRERAMAYLLRSIEAYEWFSKIVGGMEMFEKVMGGGKKMKVETEQSTSPQVVKRKPHVVTRSGRR